MCSCDFDPPIAYNKVVRKARKTHCCGECGALIATGERYESIWGIDEEGHPFSAKTCMRCVEIREYMYEHAECFCPAFGEMFQEVREEVSNRGYLDAEMIRAYRMIIAAKRQTKFSVEVRHD